MTATDAALYAALYGPTAAELRQSLPGMAEGLHAQLDALYEHPSIEACERLAANLGGASRAVLRLREALMREAEGNGR